MEKIRLIGDEGHGVCFPAHRIVPLFGLPDNIELSSFEAYATSSSHNLSKVGNAQLGSSYSIPAKSIVTLVGTLEILSNGGTDLSGESGLSGTYRLQNVFSGKCLRTLDNSTSNAASVVQNDCNNETFGQWNATETSTRGVYQITQVSSNKVLDMNGAASNPNGKAIIWPDKNGQNQRWILIKNSDNTYAIANLNSELVLDVIDSSGSNNAQIIQDYDNGGESQKWKLIAPTGEEFSGTYIIESVGSGKVLGVLEQSDKNGANIQQWSYGGGLNQQWEITAVANGAYEIKSKFSGKVIDVSAYSTVDGGNIHQWAPTGNANQHWTIEAVGDGSYKIISVHSGKALDVQGRSILNGGNIHQWRYVSGVNQRWLIK